MVPQNCKISFCKNIPLVISMTQSINPVIQYNHYWPSDRTYHIRLPNWFTHSIHLLRAGTAHNKVICNHGTANQIHRSNKGFKGLRVKASNHRFHKVGTKPLKEIIMDIHTKDEMQKKKHKKTLNTYVQYTYEFWTLNSFNFEKLNHLNADWYTLIKR